MQALLLLALVAQPLNVSKPENYMRAGSPSWGIEQVVPTTTRSMLTTQTYSAVTDQKLFEFGGLYNASCEAQATLCMVQTATVTITAAGYVTDAGGTSGQGACFRVEAGLSVDFVPLRNVFERNGAVAARSGYCTVNATTLGWPCDANADCGTAGVCATTVSSPWDSPKNHIKGVYVVAIADSATHCFIREDE